MLYVMIRKCQRFVELCPCIDAWPRGCMGCTPGLEYQANLLIARIMPIDLTRGRIKSRPGSEAYIYVSLHVRKLATKYLRRYTVGLLRYTARRQRSVIVITQSVNLLFCKTYQVELTSRATTDAEPRDVKRCRLSRRLVVSPMLSLDSHVAYTHVARHTQV